MSSLCIKSDRLCAAPPDAIASRGICGTEYNSTHVLTAALAFQQWHLITPFCCKTLELCARPVKLQCM